MQFEAHECCSLFWENNRCAFSNCRWFDGCWCCLPCIFSQVSPLPLPQSCTVSAPRGSGLRFARTRVSPGCCHPNRTVFHLGRVVYFGCLVTRCVYISSWRDGFRFRRLTTSNARSKCRPPETENVRSDTLTTIVRAG